MNEIVTAVVDENFDVYQRLAHLRRWQNEYVSEDEQLQVRLRQLDGNKPLVHGGGNPLVVEMAPREPLVVVNAPNIGRISE